MAETKQFLLSEEQFHALNNALALFCYDNKDNYAYSILISLQLQAMGYGWI